MRYIFVILVLVPLALADPINREGKFLSLFQVVKFENGNCTVEGKGDGVCYTAAECTANKGTVLGKCAGDYGVCCEVVGGCDGSNNGLSGSYFADEFSEAKNCKYDITAGDDIEMVRLDFEEFTLAQPDATNGVCQDDKFTVGDMTNLCGDGAGQHLYVPLSSGKASLLIKGGVVNADRKFRIKVTLIEKTDPCLPPTGCNQYYCDETMGQVSSFNWVKADYPAASAATRQLANQNIKTCFQQAKDMKKITFSMCEADDNSFSLSGDATAAAVGNANLGPTTPAPERRKREAIDFRSIFAPRHSRQRRALTDPCNSDTASTHGDQFSCDIYEECYDGKGSAICTATPTAGCTAATTTATCRCSETIATDATTEIDGACITSVGTYDCSDATGQPCNGVGQVCTADLCACGAGFAANGIACECKAGYTLQGTVCLEASTIGERCLTDANCATDSETCDDPGTGLCICAEGFIIEDGNCVLGVGEACGGADNIPCSGVNQECVADVCACTDGNVAPTSGGPCRPREFTSTTGCTAPAVGCTATAELCVANPAGTPADVLTCSCAGDYTLAPDGATCVSRLGGACTTSCTGANQQCVNSLCECDPLFTANADSSACVIDPAQFTFVPGTCGLSDGSRDYIMVSCPSGDGTKPDSCHGNRFCGTILNEYTVLQNPDNTAAGSLTTYEAPFMLSYVTNDKEDSTGSPPERGNAGFCLKWVQEP